ncbi:MAG TPA: 23S rRNA (guanosine(2251)-2'-O)-methyltransferase RlmB [Microthrixaceae bacterium]|nr:23S rRNA (guanosine(2251)-2'-O)-methyltransferase RlmB [Microthrixaceae bacterium]
MGGDQVEGRQAVRELLLAETRRVREVIVAEEMDRSEIVDDIVDLANDLKVTVRSLPRRRFDGEARTESSQGVIARAVPLAEADLDELVRGTRRRGDGERVPPLLIALDGVTDPGNLGAILRTAECAGVTGVILPRHRAVHVTPTVTKAAAGAIEHLPIAVVGGLAATIERLRSAGVWVLGLDAGGDATIHSMNVGAEPVCLVLGAEGAGLSRLVRQRCDQIVSIPMHGTLGSLNVSNAAAVAIYEVVRRRS